MVFDLFHVDRITNLFPSCINLCTIIYKDCPKERLKYAASSKTGHLLEERACGVTIISFYSSIISICVHDPRGWSVSQQYN